MDTTTQQRFKELLGQHDRVGIVVGKNPNIDEMAAALALYLSLKSSGKAVSIASSSEPIVELSSLVGIDEVKSSLGSAGGDLVVSFPYQEGEIEKVSYTIDNGQLNIVVKAGQNGLAFTEQDVQFTRGGGLPTMAIVVGTPQLASLGALAETIKEMTLVNIDNKPTNENFGDVVLVGTQFSSVSEQMATVMLSNGLPMEVDIAQNLLSGISYATNNFQNPQTSYFAFEIVAELLRRGAVRTPVVTTPVQTPAFMQQQPTQAPAMQPVAQPAPQPRQQQPMPRPQQMPRQNFGQGQRNQQNQQGRFPQRGNRQNNPNNQQNQQPNRQDEIRRALADQARTMQQQPQPQAQPQAQAPQPLQNTPPQPAPKQADAPSDWLTPKVYKGSSNPS